MTFYSAILIWGIYPKEITQEQKEVHALIPIMALSLIVKKWGKTYMSINMGVTRQIIAYPSYII